ncbi:MAG: hypothetical protein D6791_03255 [Chloroflexi bacterium]|nr:MAG: hypothetical protein D6791_03255 [Chloroflexota bacterium]
MPFQDSTQIDVSTVWVVSSDSEARRLIGLNLMKRGFNIVEASLEDGLPASNAPPRLVIVDVSLTSASGQEVVDSLRRIPGVEGVPLVLLLSTAPTAGQLAAFQPARWLEKPLDMDSLLTLVRECMASQQAE